MKHDYINEALKNFKDVYQREPFMIKMNKDYLLDLLNEKDSKNFMTLEADEEGYKTIKFLDTLIVITEDVKSITII